MFVPHEYEAACEKKMLPLALQRYDNGYCGWLKKFSLKAILQNKKLKARLYFYSAFLMQKGYSHSHMSVWKREREREGKKLLSTFKVKINCILLCRKMQKEY